MEVPEVIEQRVKALIDSGRYATREEVFEAAMTALAFLEDMADIELREDEQEEIRRAVQIGIEQLDRGEKFPGEQVFAELEERNRLFQMKKAS